MASIFNAIRNILSDSWWIVKIAVYSAPLFLVLNYNAFDGFGEVNKIIAWLILLCLYLGICSFIINRNVNNITPILPSLFNIPDMIKRAIVVLFIAIPLYLLLFYIINYIYQALNSQQVVMYIIIVCVVILLSPFIILPTVYYSVRDSLLDALNLKLILNASGNFSVAFISYVFQYVLIYGIIGYSIYRFLTEMLKDQLALNICISLFVVLSIFTLYSFCSDLYPEVIPELKEKKKKKKLRR